MLFIELADWALDWLTFGLAFFAADLQFDNDPDHVLRSFIMALCVLSTVSWLCELVLYCAGRPHGLLKMNLSAEAPVNTVRSPPCFRSQGEGVARSRLSAARASPMTSVLCTLGRWARPGRRSASSASSGRSGWC